MFVGSSCSRMLSTVNANSADWPDATNVESENYFGKFWVVMSADEEVYSRAFPTGTDSKMQSGRECFLTAELKSPSINLFGTSLSCSNSVLVTGSQQYIKQTFRHPRAHLSGTQPTHSWTPPNTLLNRPFEPP